VARALANVMLCERSFRPLNQTKYVIPCLTVRKYARLALLAHCAYFSTRSRSHASWRSLTVPLVFRVSKTIELKNDVSRGFISSACGSRSETHLRALVRRSSGVKIPSRSNAVLVIVTLSARRTTLRTSEPRHCSCACLRQRRANAPNSDRSQL
jgi:hypothetical protein